MKTYMSLQPVTIQFGLVQLNKEQAKSRMHNLTLVDGDKYQIVNAINFKAGEVFGFDGQLPKSMVDSLDTDSEQSKPKKKKADV